MNYYFNARYLYDINSNYKLANNLINMINGNISPKQVLINTCYDQIVKNVIFR